MTDCRTTVTLLWTLAFALAAATTADDVAVSTAAELTSAAKSASTSTRIVLTGDIDLGGLTTPLGLEGETCTPFCGTLEGDGHMLSGLRANGTDAGLFCALTDGAVVANLTLDASCSVTGTRRAGAVAAVAVSGEVTLRGITSRASLVSAKPQGLVPTSESRAAGGLLGAVDGATKVTVMDCVQTGSVEATGGGARSAGIIGVVATAANVTVVRCTNSGAVSCTPGLMSNSDCSAAGLVTVGSIAGAGLSVRGSTNSGRITTTHPTTLATSTSFAAGLVTTDEKDSATSISNCANTGEVSVGTTKGDGCGLYAVSNTGTRPNITNSVNAGKIGTGMNLGYDKRASGITSRAGKVHNVVSMGTLSGNSNFLFFISGSSADGIYALKDMCQDCKETPSTTTYFTQAGNGTYMVGTRPLVDALNESNPYGAWTRDVRPFERFVTLTVTPTTGSPTVFPIAAGSTFGDVTQLRRDYPCDTNRFNDTAADVLHRCTDTITADVTVTPTAWSCVTFNVRVSGLETANLAVPIHSYMWQISVLTRYFGRSDHVVLNAKTREHLTRDMTVEDDMDILVQRLETVRVWIEIDVPASGSTDVAGDLRVAIDDSDDDIYGVSVVPGATNSTFVTDIVVSSDAVDRILAWLAHCGASLRPFLSPSSSSSH